MGVRTRVRDRHLQRSAVRAIARRRGPVRDPGPRVSGVARGVNLRQGAGLMTIKRFGCLGLLLLLLFFSLLLNVILAAANGKKLTTSRLIERKPPQFDETTVESGASSDKVAIVSLQGLISSSVAGVLGDNMVDDMKIALRQAAEDDKVKAIILHIDSPGGEVTAADTIYNAVRAARTRKPVVVYMGSVAASGGYYVACGGNYLMANETTITGSIGVIIETVNYEGLLDKIGVQAVVFKSGAYKDILSGSRPMTPEEKAYVQRLVMQTYDKFVTIVADERRLPVDQLRHGIADGRILSGVDALQDKLIDHTGYIEDAFKKAKELAHAPDARVVKYQAKFHLGRLFKMLGQAAPPTLELSLPQGLAPRLEPGRLYLLPQF